MPTIRVLQNSQPDPVYQSIMFLRVRTESILTMVVVVGFLLSEKAFGLLAPRSNMRTASPLYMSDSPAVTEFSRDPCWEDIYDDDCVMSSVAAASFVAGEWIKRMPCAAGLEVCNDSHDYLCPFDCLWHLGNVVADTFDVVLCLLNRIVICQKI
jgi:hypothetical protein